MKHKNNTKIAAVVALFAIIVSIVGTGILVVIDIYSSSNNTSNDTSIELEQLLKDNNIDLPTNESSVINVGSGGTISAVTSTGGKVNIVTGEGEIKTSTGN